MFDRLAHPMVVKELRQGLKSKAFAGGLVVLQLLLALCMLLYLTILHSPRTSASDLQDADLVFWMAVGFGMLVLIPLRALFSVSQERTQGTLELLYLTPMSCKGIVRGKNLVLLVQAFLLFSTATPYMVLRYYFGDFDAQFQVMAASGALGGSGFLIGVGIWISTFEGKATRITLAIISGLFCLLIGMIFYEEMQYGSTPGPGQFLGAAISLGVYGAFFVEAGTARIATVSENHAPMQRLLGFVVFLMALAGGAMTGDGALVALGMFLLIPMFVANLCERTHPLKSLHLLDARVPFSRSRLLIPGWFSATMFTSLCASAFLLTAFVVDLYISGNMDEEVYTVILIFHNLLLFPVVFMQFRPIEVEKRMMMYLLITFAGVLLGLVGFLLESAGLLGDVFFRGFLPAMALFHSMDSWGNNQVPANLFVACIFSLTILAKNGKVASPPTLIGGHKDG